MGCFDLQVNGYAGVDFNQDDLCADDLHRACAMMHEHGMDGVLATIITEDVDRMANRLHRLVQLRDADSLVERMIAGIHIEGPFLNEADGFRGAHPRDAVIPAQWDVMQRLLDAARGLTRLVTLAPERDENLRVTQALAQREIVIAAGHCDPTLDQLDAAIDAGLSMFTHLGNGCPMSMHRHDNVIQRALARADRLWLCFIADGVHIPFYALRNYLKLAGQRGIVVTDAMAAAGLEPGIYQLGRWQVRVDEDRAARSPDGAHLVGSAMTMVQARQNLATHCGLTIQQIDEMTCHRPRQVIMSQ